MIKGIKIKTFNFFYLDLVAKYLTFFVIVSSIKLDLDQYFQSETEKLVYMSQLIRSGIN
jgi:hypothetical protein